jgi:hypothetical protein
MTALAVNQNASVFRQISQTVWLYFMLLLLGIVSRHSSAVVTPRFLNHAFFPEKVGAFQSAFFVGGFEDQTISEIQSEDAGLLATERRNERS